MARKAMMRIEVKTKMGQLVVVFAAEVNEAQALALCGVPLANAIKPVVAKAAKAADDWDKVTEADVRQHFPTSISRKGEGTYPLTLVSVAPYVAATTSKVVDAAAVEKALAAGTMSDADLLALLAKRGLGPAAAAPAPAAAEAVSEAAEAAADEM